MSEATGNEFEVRSAEDLFGTRLKEGKDVSVKVWLGKKDVPAKVDGYMFRPQLLQTLLLWLSGKAGKNLFLSGPSGSGKTSGIEQVAAATGRSVIRVGCHRDLEMVDLIGRWVITGKDKWEFHYGPLPTAMREGYVLLLDEADTLLPATAMGLNSILDGAALYIPETNEFVHPTSQFLIAATGNTNGQGDSTGNYRGTTKQNLAWGDRFLMDDVVYLSPEEELSLLNKVVPSVPLAYREKAIKFAGQARLPFLSDDTMGIKPSVTLTTRGLVRWMQSFEMLKNLGSPDPLRRALELSLLKKGTASDRVFFEELYQGIGVGDAATQPQF